MERGAAGGAGEAAPAGDDGMSATLVHLPCRESAATRVRVALVLLEALASAGRRLELGRMLRARRYQRERALCEGCKHLPAPMRAGRKCGAGHKPAFREPADYGEVNRGTYGWARAGCKDRAVT